MDRDNDISTWSLAAILWLALVITFGIVNHERFFSAQFLEMGDDAVNGIYTEHARHFAEIYGNYSRFQFNHPGPVFYYAYALGELVLRDWLGVCPTPGNAHLATIMVVQSAFFALAAAMFCSSWRWRAWLPLALLGAAIQFGPVPGAFLITWPPQVLLMPSLAFLVACISVACGRWDHLLVMVLAGGFLFHGHVAQSLVVGTLGPLALGLNLVRHRRAAGAWSLRQWFSGHRASWIGFGLLAGLFLLPLAIDVTCYGGHSNVATILARFHTNTTDAKNPWQSLLYFLSFGTSAGNQEELFTTIGPATRAFFAANTVRLAVWGVIWLLPPVALLSFRRHLAPRDRMLLATGWLFFVCAAGLCVMWGMAQAGHMFNFNGVFYYGVFYLALMLALAVVSRAIDRWYRPAAAGAIVAVAAVLLSWQRTMPSLHGVGMQIRSAVENALAGETLSGPRFLVFEAGSWIVAAAVALELERRGVGFRVAPWWSFMFGREHELAYSTNNRSTVWWITTPAPDGLPLTPELSLYRLAAPIQPEGDEVRFKSADNGSRYVVCGLSSSMEWAYSNLPRACFLFATPPAKHDVHIAFDAGSVEFRDGKIVPQPAEVFFNGVPIGRVEVVERREVAVRVPADVWNAAPSALLELHFPACFADAEPGRPAYQGRGAWILFAMRFRPTP
ncbi:MAG TPA: hypothetical protein VFD82_00915 [Planctomycetota bacterium]|nr:hypothetical protein [Planctomycetota bacterium]